MDDRQLLKQFTQHNSQQAFAALTARYLSLVYSTCRRELGDADLAEDVTQAVFLILARKAPSLGRSVVLSGWLFQTARFAARNARLQESRRKATEEKAGETLRIQQRETEDAQWIEIEPLLNQSLAALRDGERECVLLRFFQGMSFAEAGTVLGLSEEAARKRVTRALDKMRQVFVKNGVIVPALALPALLTAHAAKAIPISLAPAVAQSTASIAAGHAAAAPTGSHAYQLSQGALNAMKIAQIKLAVGITVAVLGVSTYAVTRGIAAPHFKPNHVLQQVPGRTPTAAQIAARCQSAYSALQSYQGTTVSVTQGVTSIAGTTTIQFRTSATIQFVRPDRILVEGIDMSGSSFGYVTDGVSVAEDNALTKGVWKKAQNVDMSIAAVTGTAQTSATTLPSLLLGSSSLSPFSAPNKIGPEVREDTVDDRHCYVITITLVKHIGTVTTRVSRLLYVDKKTFLLRRVLIDTHMEAQTFVIAGKSYPVPETTSEVDQRFTNERINQPIPDSTFTLPAVQ